MMRGCGKAEQRQRGNCDAQRPWWSYQHLLYSTASVSRGDTPCLLCAPSGENCWPNIPGEIITGSPLGFYTSINGIVSADLKHKTLNTYWVLIDCVEMEDDILLGRNAIVSITDKRGSITSLLRNPQPCSGTITMGCTSHIPCTKSILLPVPIKYQYINSPRNGCKTPA